MSLNLPPPELRIETAPSCGLPGVRAVISGGCGCRIRRRRYGALLTLTGTLQAFTIQD